MMPQKSKVHFTETIDQLDQAPVVGHPGNGVRELALGQKNRLRPVLIAMRQILVGAVQLWVLLVVAGAVGITAAACMPSQRSTQHRRPLGQLLKYQIPLLQQLAV